MTQVVENQTQHHNDLEDPAVVMAEAWWDAKSQEKELKKELKPIEEKRKNAAHYLALALNPGDTVTVHGNTKVEWVDREDPSVSYAKVLEGLKPHLNIQQVALLENLIAEHTGVRTVQELKRVK